MGDVMWRSGSSDPAAAEAAIGAVLDALGALLTPTDARFVSARLPHDLAAPFAARAPHVQPEPSALYDRLASSEGVSVGVALERARAACAALAESFEPEERKLLARRLPPEWAALFEPAPRAPRGK